MFLKGFNLICVVACVLYWSKTRHSQSNTRKSNSILGLSSIKFGNRTKSDAIKFVEFDFRTNRTQSNKPNPVELYSIIKSQSNFVC